MQASSGAIAQIPRPAVYLLRCGGLGAIYFVVASLGLRYASIGQSVSLVWPPTGIALAALVVWDRRVWPGVTLGAFLANATTPVPLLTAAAIAAGNTLEAVLAATLLLRAAGPRPRLDSLPAARALVLAAAPLGALVSALVGVSALLASHAVLPADAVAAMAVWWTGDVLGALVVAPLVLAWSLIPPLAARGRGPLEVALLCLGTVVAAELGLGRLLPGPSLFRQLDYLYLLFPFVIWAALRFGSRGASLMSFTVSVVAVWRTVQGGGPFNIDHGGGTLFAVACYLGVVAVVGLLLAAAVMYERETATETLRRREDQLRLALDAARMGVWFWSFADGRLVGDDTLRRMYGLGADVAISYAELLVRVHPEDRAFVETALRRTQAEGGRFDHEFRIVLPDGRVRWIADQGRVVAAEGGAPAGMTGASIDVTERRAAEERLRIAHRMESAGRLAGGVAHEANNQMGVVIGAAKFILARPDISRGVRSDAELIVEAAERTAWVTAQLLAFSRRQVLRPKVLELDEVLKRLQPVLQRTMGEDCVVALALEPGVGAVKADPGQIETACPAAERPSGFSSRLRPSGPTRCRASPTRWDQGRGS